MDSSYIIPTNLADVSSTNWCYTGIYKITNIVSGICYIGQAIDIRARLMGHINAMNKKDLVVYKAIRKYGIDNFDCRVLVTVNTFGKTQEEIKKELNFLECFYIDLYDSYKNGYNMTPGGDSGRLGFKHKKETIEKIKNAHRNYIPKVAKDVSKITYAYDLLTNSIIRGESIADISHKTGVDYRSVGQIARNKNYKKGGRFISSKRWLFSFDKADLANRVDWYFSDEYKNKPKGRPKKNG